jgi:hypothetical protein
VSRSIPIDPYDDDSTDDGYFDGDELDEDVLYSLFNSDDYYEEDEGLDAS